MSNQIVDANGALHASQSGRFTGHLHGEAEANTVLRPGPDLFASTDGDEYEGSDGVISHMVVSQYGRARGWYAYRLDADPNDEFDYVAHNADGPALIRDDGTLEWRRWDERHNFDGPAVVGHGTDAEYWLYGKRYSHKDWLALAGPLREQIGEAQTRGKDLFDRYAEAHDAGEDPETVIRDMISDLGHYWRSQGLDVHALLLAGLDRVEEELTDPVV